MPDEKSVRFGIAAFRSSDADLWFLQLERQFSLHKIVDDNVRFTIVEQYLDDECTREVKDILLDPPEVNKYKCLKNKLVKRFSTSQEKKMQQLLQGEALGDRRPTQFLRHLRELAGATASDKLLRTIWLGRMPESVRSILAILDEPSLDKVAEAANRIIDTHGGPRICSATATAPVTPPGDKRTNDLEAKIEAISRQLQEVLSERRSQNRGKQANYRRGRSRSKSRARNSNANQNNC